MQQKNFPDGVLDPIIFGGPPTYLRTITSHQVCGLLIGHYESNPSAAPDHALMVTEVPRVADGTSLQTDFHYLVQVGPTIMAQWPGPDPTRLKRDLLIVSGHPIGWVILCDAFSESFAYALFDKVKFCLGSDWFAD